MAAIREENEEEVDPEVGLRGPAISDQEDFNTPLGSALRQSRFRVPTSVNPTTARLRRVSSSLLRAAPGNDDQFGDGVGGGQQGRRQNPPPPPPRTGERTPNQRYYSQFGTPLNTGPAQQHQQQQQQQRAAPRQNNGLPITGQHSKFVRDDDLPDDQMLDIEVSLKKEDYGVVGSSDYRKNRAMATAPLSEKFGVARHKILTDAEEGDQSKYAHIQAVIVSVLHRVKQGELRARAVDWMDICVIPFLIEANLSNPDCSTWWDSSEINIWQDWDVLQENQVRRWQYSINKRFSDGDRIASNWLLTFVSDSSTDSLRTAVQKKYEKLDVSQKGGVVYLYLTLSEMFQMSREVEEAMHKFIDLFKRTGVSRFTGENLLVVQEQITGVCKRLDTIGALRPEHVMDVLQGLSICSNVKFRDIFKHLKQTAELNNLSILLPTIPIDASPMEQIEGVLEKAVDQYDLQCTAGLWNKVSRGGSALKSIVEAVAVCWNCGEKGHTARECKKAKDPVAYNKRRKEFLENKARNGNSGNGGGDKPQKGTAEYNRKQWESNACSMVDGVLYIKCKTCGLNMNHGSRSHSEYAKNPATFRLASTHFYVKECIRLGQGYGGGLAATHGGPTVTPAPPSDSSMITIDKNKVERLLADYERTSTNPNASEMTEMMRSLLLK